MGVKEILFLLIFRIPRKFREISLVCLGHVYMTLFSWLTNTSIGVKSSFNGIPRIIMSKGAYLTIGNNFRLNSGQTFNPIGRNQRSKFFIAKEASISIGNNVGMSSVTIFCERHINIGNNIRIGGNVVMYDTDFHSLKIADRSALPERKHEISRDQILIEDGVFIGAHTIILKGVTIGKNSVIGAGSVVSKSIPGNEIWAGNPIQFIRSLNQ